MVEVCSLRNNYSIPRPKRTVNPFCWRELDVLRLKEKRLRALVGCNLFGCNPLEEGSNTKADPVIKLRPIKLPCDCIVRDFDDESHKQNICKTYGKNCPVFLFFHFIFPFLNSTSYKEQNDHDNEWDIFDCFQHNHATMARVSFFESFSSSHFLNLHKAD